MRVEGAPPTGRAPCLVGTSCALRTLFSCTILLLVGKNSLYNLMKVLTTVPRKYPLFLFQAVFLTDLDHHDVFKRPQGQVFREGHQSLPRGGAATPSNHWDAWGGAAHPRCWGTKEDWKHGDKALSNESTSFQVPRDGGAQTQRQPDDDCGVH